MQFKAPIENAPIENDKKQTFELPQPFADAIGKYEKWIICRNLRLSWYFKINVYFLERRLVLEKFSEVTANIDNYSRRKVLAGIVMIENNDVNTAKVISVSTGTKCVNGEHMSISGTSLNDSHAEIVSRRCLIDYLYSQLELHTNASQYQWWFPLLSLHD